MINSFPHPFANAASTVPDAWWHCCLCMPQATPQVPLRVKWGGWEMRWRGEATGDPLVSVMTGPVGSQGEGEKRPRSGMRLSHPPSHQFSGSCKIHYFPSTHPGGNNDNKNKIRTTPFPRLGGREGNELLGTAWISQPLLANVTFQRESHRHRLVLCVCRNGVFSQPFPCHWIWSEGLWACHFPHAKEADLSSLLWALCSQPLLPHLKKTRNPPTM